MCPKSYKGFETPGAGILLVAALGRPAHHKPSGRCWEGLQVKHRIKKHPFSGCLRLGLLLVCLVHHVPSVGAKREKKPGVRECLSCLLCARRAVAGGYSAVVV